MKLAAYEQEMLDGKHGEAKRFSMEKLVEFGIAVGAEEMVPVTLVLHFCPIVMEDRSDPRLAIYDLGHSSLYDPFFKMKDAKVADTSKTWCGNDPYLMQIDKYEETGYPWNFSAKGGSFKVDKEIADAYIKGYNMLQEQGWVNWLSCTPQFNTRIPKFGEYCASSESSAAAYINTFLGARTNRENTITALYAAYTGVLPKYGTHLDENRRAKLIIELTDEVRDNLADAADWAALGAAIAEKGRNQISAVLNLPRVMSPTAAKQLTSCASPGMNDPLLHLMGHTPESPTLEHAFGGRIPKDVERQQITIEDVKEVYRYLNRIAPAPPDMKVDIVVMGCPHLTYEEVKEIARLVKGKKVAPSVHLWVQTDTPSYWMAHNYGDAKAIEDAGGKIYHQTCMGMNPVRYYPKGLTIATDSFKYVKLGGGMGCNFIFGAVPDLINAAVTGSFKHNTWRAPVGAAKTERPHETERPLLVQPGPA